MIRPILGAAALALALLAAPPAAQAADVPFAGSWKVTVVENGQAVGFCIVKLEGTDAKPEAKLVAGLGRFGKAKVDDLKVEKDSVHFSLAGEGPALPIAAYPAKGDDKPKMLYASFQLGPQMLVGRLDRTEDTEIKPAEAAKPEEGFDKLGKLQSATDEDKVKGYKELLEKEAGKPVGLFAGLQLLQTQSRAKEPAAEADLKATAEAVNKAAEPYGHELQLQMAVNTANALMRADKGAAVAAEVARKAEKLLTDKDPPARTVAVLRALTAALHKAGKADDAKPFAERLAKLNKQLDEEFEKDAIPFKPEKFAGRKGKGDRVAVVELFTGAQCPPCVSADIAFDAALKSYAPTEVVFLQYHLHIPGPDPLTNADAEARAKYYGGQVRGTPTAFVDGKVTEGLGGFKQHGEERYKTLSKLINEAVETDPNAGLKLSATRKGDKIDIKADVSGLKKTGDKVRLRLVLVEEVAGYAGNNGQRLHHHVVRAFPGGVDGMPLEKESATQNVTVNLGEVRKTLGEYLTEKNKSFNGYWADDDLKQAFKELKVVALVQDDESKQILQAAQVAVPAE
jgi:hypothetical protein